MAPLQTIAGSQLIELAEKSFNTFCEDISGMFGIDIKCIPQPVGHETVNSLQPRFQDLAVVYSARAEGALDSTIRFVFDQQGLFILAGVVAMQTEQIILEDVKSASLEKAMKTSSILKEVGTALTGAWERIFSKGLEGHGRFVQTGTFIGNPWDNSGEKIGLAADEECVFIPYEVTVGSFPTFKCGVIFQKEIFDSISESGTDQLSPTDENAQEQTESSAPNASEGTEENENTTPNVSGDAEEIVAADENAPQQEPEAAIEQMPNDAVETETVQVNEMQEQPVSEAIKKMAEQSVLPDEESQSTTTQKTTLTGKDTPLIISAKDIMQKNVIWMNPDESVQKALAKIQQHNVGYLMVGREKVLEGIVSKSDLTGALSPYLRNIFAKWRRPLDDATLRIRIKWIMSKPTCTVVPDTPLAVIMENMCQAGIRCLPVVDEQGSVQGLVTAFDIFRVLLRHSYLS
jgi:CBS domain-containing protein